MNEQPILAVLLVVCLLLTAACGGGRRADRTTEDTSEALSSASEAEGSGKYYTVSRDGSVYGALDAVLTLSEDGAALYRVNNSSDIRLKGTWELKRKTLTLVLGDEEYEGSLKDGILTIEIDGEELILIEGKSSAKDWLEEAGAYEAPAPAATAGPSRETGGESDPAGGLSGTPGVERPEGSSSGRIRQRTERMYSSFNGQEYMSETTLTYDEEGIVTSLRSRTVTDGAEGSLTEAETVREYDGDGLLSAISLDIDGETYRVEIGYDRDPYSGEVLQVLLYISRDGEYVESYLKETESAGRSISLDALLSMFLRLVENYAAFRNVDVSIAGTQDYLCRYVDGELYCRRTAQAGDLTTTESCHLEYRAGQMPDGTPCEEGRVCSMEGDVEDLPGDPDDYLLTRCLTGQDGRVSEQYVYLGGEESPLSVSHTVWEDGKIIVQETYRNGGLVSQTETEYYGGR